MTAVGQGDHVGSCLALEIKDLFAVSTQNKLKNRVRYFKDLKIGWNFMMLQLTCDSEPVSRAQFGGPDLAGTIRRFHL